MMPFEFEAHQCHFCGEWVQNGREHPYTDDAPRHWLSDCRPDLTEHEPGELCTWSWQEAGTRNCYAFEMWGEDHKRVWTDEHTHFYPDGPM